MPPSPKGLPLFGNLFDVRLKGLLDVGELAARFGPVFSLRIGVHTLVVLASAELVREVLVGHAPACADRPRFLNTDVISGGGKSTLLSDGEAAVARRSLLVRAFFHPRHLPELVQLVNSELDLILARFDNSEHIVRFNRDILDRGRFNIGHRLITSRSPDNEQLRAAFEEEERHFGLLLADFFPPLQPWARLVWLRPLTQAIRYFHTTYELLIQQRKEAIARGARRPGALDSILVEREQMISAGRGEIAEHCADNALGYMMYNLFGTMNPTHIAVMHTVWLLVRHPEVLRRLSREVNEGVEQRYLRAVVQEAMRLRPPTPLLVPRLVTEDIVLTAGLRIPRGAIVLADIASSGRDPARWDDPDTFRPARFLDESAEAGSLPFGVGPRACPAKGLATTIVELWITRLLTQFDLTEHAGGGTGAVRDRAHIFNQMPPDFSVRLAPRQQKPTTGSS